MNNLTDEALLVLQQEGDKARRIYAQRVNSRIDARELELVAEIKNRIDAIELVKAHRAKQHPVVQKYVDQVLNRMERQLSEISYEKDMLHYQRLPLELIGQASAW